MSCVFKVNPPFSNRSGIVWTTVKEMQALELQGRHTDYMYEDHVD